MRRFEWDSKKAAANVRKHAVRFEDAALAFDDPFGLIVDDEAHSASEHRQMLIALANRVVVVIFTIRGDAFRIISARKASRHERNIYEKTKIGSR